MLDPVALLREARRVYDDARNGLGREAAAAGRHGFAGGAQWMRHGLGVLRGERPHGHAAFHRLGCAKYALATAVAAAVTAVAWCVSPVLLPLGVVAFYAVECRMVFAFPLALDGSRTPLCDSHMLVSSSAPAALATATVMRIAAEMLVGGFRGRGFVRSWCVGCLAVLLWYEQALAGAAVRA